MDFIDISTFGGFALLVLGFGFIIFVHELGHFLVAKWVGVRCPYFAIGMGFAGKLPPICSYRKGVGFKFGGTDAIYRKRAAEQLEADGIDPATATEEQYYAAGDKVGLGQTEYRLMPLPLGGYVMMLGQEDIDPSAQSDDPAAFNNKPIWARAAVISAGVVMNIIFGVIFFLIAFRAGVDFNAPQVGDISQLAAAAEPYAEGHKEDIQYKGLQTGDVIKTFDGVPIGDLTEVRINTALAEKGVPVTVVVDRPLPNGEYETLEYEIVPESDASGLLSLGFAPPTTLELPKGLRPEAMPKPLADAGVRGGMVIVEAGGKEVEHYYEYQRRLVNARGLPVPVVFQDPKTEERIELELAATANMNIIEPADGDFTYHLLGFVPATAVMQVVPKSPAEEAGLQTGDVIVRIGSVAWPGPRDIVAVVTASEGAVDVTVLRGEERLELSITPGRDGKIGILPGSMNRLPADLAATPHIRDSIEDQPAEKLNLVAGSQIVSVDGKDVADYTDFQRALLALAEQNPKGFTFTLGAINNVGKERKVSEHEITVSEQQAGELRLAGWDTPPIVFMMDMVPIKADSMAAALGLGAKKTWQSMQQVYLTLLRVAQQSVSPKNFQGPVGIAHTGTRIAKQGFTYLMFFLGLISVNLAVINFLPIPIVDGGHIVFLIIEKIKGSPVGPRVQTAALYVGLVLLACVFLYVTYNDIVRLVQA